MTTIKQTTSWTPWYPRPQASGPLEVVSKWEPILFPQGWCSTGEKQLNFLCHSYFKLGWLAGFCHDLVTLPHWLAYWLHCKRQDFCRENKVDVLLLMPCSELNQQDHSNYFSLICIEDNVQEIGSKMAAILILKSWLICCVFSTPNKRLPPPRFWCLRHPSFIIQLYLRLWWFSGPSELSCDFSLPTSLLRSSTSWNNSCIILNCFQR